MKKFPASRPIWVQFSLEELKKSQGIVNFHQHVVGSNFKFAVLVTRNEMSPAMRKSLTETAKHARVECFTLEELETNITHHELVPKHVLLSREEKTALLESQRLKVMQLPRIKQSDPVARYLGLLPGDVVKIIRREGQYPTLYYRLCER